MAPAGSGAQAAAPPRSCRLFLSSHPTPRPALLLSSAAAIPEPLRDALPPELKEALLKPRGPDSAGSASSSGSSSSGSTQPLVTWTLNSDDEDGVTLAALRRNGNGAAAGGGGEEDVPVSPQQLAARQTGASAGGLTAAPLLPWASGWPGLLIWPADLAC